MSTVEAIKKKGRPKKTVANNNTILAEPVIVKAKKPRISSKSTTTSPNDQRTDEPLPEAQDLRGREPPLSSSRAQKPPKSQPMKSVAAETAILASRQVKAPSSRPEPSFILKQAVPFVRSQKEESSPKSAEAVDSQIRPKEFKPAGTLPAISILDAIKPASPTASSQVKTSLFLAEFFTQPPLAEQPAWSRPKKPAAVSASPSTSCESGKASETTTSPSRLDTSVLPSTSPLLTAPKILFQYSFESQTSQTPISDAEANSEASSRPSPRPQQQYNHSRSLSEAAVQSPSQAAMTTPSPASKATQKPSSIPRALPKIPPHLTSAQAPLKPTDMPYEVLKQDPKFKALSRRYTALIVSIPILLATSYALYGRYMETTVQRKRILSQGTSTINGGV